MRNAVSTVVDRISESIRRRLIDEMVFVGLVEQNLVNDLSQDLAQ
jgi:hypothetical protein